MLPAQMWSCWRLCTCSACLHDLYRELKLVPGARQEAKAHADRHRKLMQALAADVAAARPASAAELVEFVRDADARLAVVVADEAAVVAQFPAFPKVWPERRCIGLGN